jgi:type IV pilus assembly protein PilB
MLKTFDFEKIPIVEVVNEILVDASKRNASDIHFDPMAEHLKVRIRIDGELMDYALIPNTLKRNLITRIKIISGMNITETRLPQDGAIKTELKDINLDLRVSCLPTNEGEKMVIRIMDYSMSLKGLEYLGFTEKNYKKMLKMIAAPNGIILVTGATGSGKSTTVYAVLQRLNSLETNLLTVEDPIEMDIEGVNQTQVNSDIGLTFANVLRSILRQDPDIIMIGEIRDTETAKIAVRASITGHLVLSTLHTNTALTTIERLLDMEVERYLLASALCGLVSQKLARRLCEKCRHLRPTNNYEKELFQKVLGKTVNEIYTASGCEECTNGYRGRIAIHEVLLINEAIRDAISNSIKAEDLRELVYQSDVTTMIQDGLEKVIDGITTFEEILKLIELEDTTDNDNKNYGLKDAIEDTKYNYLNKLDESDKSLIKNNESIIKEVPTIETTPVVNNSINETNIDSPLNHIREEEAPEIIANN